LLLQLRETRGPEQVKKEFEQIQEESFTQQQKILQFIRDARTLEIPDYKISDSLKRLKNDELVGALMYGEVFTPYTYYSSAFEKRYDTALRDSQLNGTTPPNFNYVFPIKELEEVMVNHSNLDLTISYKENMKKIAERKASFKNKKVKPNEIEQPKIDSNENILNLLKGKQVKQPVQPLPPQPTATAVSVASAPSLNYNQLPETEKYKTVFPNG